MYIDNIPQLKPLAELLHAQAELVKAFSDPNIGTVGTSNQKTIEDNAVKVSNMVTNELKKQMNDEWHYGKA